jgi:hypothetical protein
MDVNEKKYAAGFFDGDGSVYITVEHGSIYRLGVRVSGTNRESLEWLLSRFGGWVVKAADPRKNRKPGWQWVCSASRAENFLETVKNFLSIKTEQVNLAILLLKRKERRFRYMSPVELAARETIRVRLSEMKKRLDLPTPDGFADEAYAAGFFDAEGSVSITASGSSTQLSVNVVNTIYASLEFLRRAFGGTIYSKGESGGDGCKRVPSWTLRFVDRDAVKFLMLTRPYLIVKRKQADLGIKYYSEKQLVGRRMGRFEVGLKYSALMRDMNVKSNPIAMAL